MSRLSRIRTLMNLGATQVKELGKGFYCSFNEADVYWNDSEDFLMVKPKGTVAWNKFSYLRFLQMYLDKHPPGTNQ